MKIIVLQLARLGDILQSLPAIQGLKRKNPQAEITLVVRKKFADAARVSPYVNRIVELDTRSILEPFITDATAEGKSASLETLKNWIQNEFGNTEYDALYNFTFSEASTHLSGLIKAKSRFGLYTASDKISACDDSWSRHFVSQVQEKNFNILHLNDIFCRIAEVSREYWPIILNEAKPAKVKSPDKIRIGMQLTASQTEKAPPADAWITICNKISQIPNTEFVFFGAQADRSIIEKVVEKSQIAHRSIILAGTLQFFENESWIRSCDTIVSPDTAIVHFASLCGTRLVYLPFGGVRPEETGPYGNGHSILYPANKDIETYATAVAKAVLWDQRSYSGIQNVPHSVSKFIKCSDGSERSVLIPENFSQEETANLFMQSYYLLAEFRSSGRNEDIAVPTVGDPNQKGSLDKLSEAHEVLLSVARTAEFGSRYCYEMMKNINDPDELKSIYAQVAEVDGLLDSLAKTNKLVKPLIDGFKVNKSFARGANLEELIGVTEGTYRELRENVEITIQLIQTAVQAAHDRLNGTTTDKVNNKGVLL